MYLELSLSEKESKVEVQQVSSLLEAVETILDKSLNQARNKLLRNDQDADLALLLKRRDFREYFKYALAMEAAQVIAAYDQNVKAVYLFEESTNPDAEMEDYPSFVDMTVHLLLLVAAASAALDAFSISLDRTLTAALRELPCEALTRSRSLLHIEPVTESDIENGRGYAKLLTSVYARPLKIWQSG